MEVKLNRFLNQIWPRGQQFANLTDWKALMKIFFFFSVLGFYSGPSP
jgi:hypothetical protein